ncbi:MAG: hypothetical protein ACOYO0_14360, partial [Sandarakinorhabdus sp.]
YLLIMLVLLAAPAQARLTQSTADSFISANSADLPVPPAAVWTALLDWGGWWDPAHSYSRVPGAMMLQAEAGGVLIERWPGGSVAHASVLMVMPASVLRLSGGFGPLQALPVGAILEFSLKAQGTGTSVMMTYRVAGNATSGLDTLAAPVDAVMSAAFQRLARHAGSGKPAGQ